MRPFVRIAQSLSGASIGSRTEDAASASNQFKALSLARKFLKHVEARRKVHHIYYVLAAFDLAAIATGLYFTHHVNSVLLNTVQANLAWSALHTDVGGLREASTRVNAPGNDVFLSKDAALELKRFDQAVAAFEPYLVHIKREFGGKIPDDRATAPLQALTAVEAAARAMMERTRAVLGHYAKGELEAAGTAMALLDQSYAVVLTEFDVVTHALRRIENELGQAGLQRVLALRSVEYMLGLMIVLIVCAVTVYGHWIGKLFHQRYAEVNEAHAAARALAEQVQAANTDITKLNTELADFNAKLEERVADRTRDLEAANADIGKLNVELANNIRKLKEAQDEIIRKAKLAQLGQLTATVAHEIRNPLGAVRTAAYLVERKVKDKGLGVEQQLQRINNGVTRCDRIITELLDFARSTSPVCKTVAVDEWVRQVVEEEAKTLPAMVERTCDLGLGDMTAAFDIDRMRRVIINLLSNASEAMVGKGKDPQDIATWNPMIHLATRLVGNTIEITVTDNGPGIPEENLQKILEPLFSTKSFGTGLGLPAVEKILEQHGGGLRIKSKLGEGTAMTAWFPVAQRERKAA